jgi:hypothetical protein
VYIVVVGTYFGTGCRLYLQHLTHGFAFRLDILPNSSKINEMFTNLDVPKKNQMSRRLKLNHCANQKESCEQIIIFNELYPRQLTIQQW